MPGGCRWWGDEVLGVFDEDEELVDGGYGQRWLMNPRLARWRGFAGCVGVVALAY